MSSLLKLLNRWELVAFISLIVILSLRGSYWSGQYTAEESAHVKTQIKLSQAITEAKAWQDAYALASSDAMAQSQATQACLDREQKQQQAKKERDDLSRQAKVRSLTQQEKDEIVDDEVRKKYIDRFNRPL